MWKALLVVVVVVAGVVGLAFSKSAHATAGTVSFDLIPRQKTSPVAVLAVALRGATLLEPRLQVRNESARAVRAITPAVLVRTPQSTRMVTAREVPVALRPGEQTEISAPLPALWDSTPWHTYPSGVMFTIGLASVGFFDGTAWNSGERGDGRFEAAPGLAVKNHTGIGRLPWWLFPGLGDVVFLNIESPYPINSSLDEDQCVMSFCAQGHCEFDGCGIR